MNSYALRCLSVVACIGACLAACRRAEPEPESRPEPVAELAELSYDYAISPDLLEMADVSYEYMRNNYTYRIQPIDSVDTIAFIDPRFIINWDITVVHRLSIRMKYDFADTAFLRHYGLLRDTYNIYATAAFSYIPRLDNDSVAMPADTLAHYRSLSRIGVEPQRLTLAELEQFIRGYEQSRERQIEYLERCYEITTDSAGWYSVFAPRLYWQ